MRKLTVATALVMAMAAHGAYAQDREVTADSTGCGVGTILFEGQQGVAPQVLAVTTNGSLGNQTFGITSGTLGCTRDGVVKPPAEVRMLVVSSLDNLATEVARGEGETLDSLAALMRIEERDKARFLATLQANFARIFPSEEVSAEAVTTSMYAVMAEDDLLSRYVAA